VSSFPREITETALAHVIGDKAEQAYRRGDALEKRRTSLGGWEGRTVASATPSGSSVHHARRCGAGA
jgi:hypothetical protein